MDNKIVNFQKVEADNSVEVKEYNDSDLIDCIIKLHEIAGTVEKTLGVGNLSERIRYSADILAQLMKKI